MSDNDVNSDGESLFTKGLESLERENLDEARDYFLQAVEANYVGDVYVELSELERISGNEGEYLRYVKLAAENGHTLAQLFQGQFEYDADNVDAAKDWWEKAAIAGNTDAMAMLGNTILEDPFDANDEEKAFFWLEKAAELENVFAMLRLAEELEPEDALKLLFKAAELGDDDAVIEIARLVIGLGDISLAGKWWKRAEELGVRKI